MGISYVPGSKTTVSKGMAAPTAKVPAEASAACTGLALSVSEKRTSAGIGNGHATRGIERGNGIIVHHSKLGFGSYRRCSGGD